MVRIRAGRGGFVMIIGAFFIFLILSGAIQFALASAKNTFPANRITWIVPGKAGGGFDLTARCIAPYLSMHLKELAKGVTGGDIMIKNEEQAGGRRAYSNIFHARPDGYTIGYFHSAFVTDNITSEIEFDCSTYAFLVRAGVSSAVILTRKDMFKTWGDMMKAGREKELKWACGAFSRGGHVTGILTREVAKVPARLVNFPGNAENMNALLRGDVHLAVVTEEAARPMIASGEVRALTILSQKSQYPGVPSIAELGYPELIEASQVHRMVIGPPSLSKEIRDIYIAAFRKVFNNKDFLLQAKKMDFEPDPVYGDDAERLAKKLFKYYDEKTPVLKKYLQ